MLKLSVISFFAFATFLGIHSAQSVEANDRSDDRISHYTCSLELALAPNDASASIVSGTTRSPDDAQRKPKKQEAHFANLIGRGLADCKNQQGFQFTLPAVMAISLNSQEQVPLDSLRATVEPVSVDSDVHKIFDQYTPHVELKHTPSLTPAASADRTVVVKGLKNDVLIQINLALPKEFTAKVNVAKVDLKFDNEAPSLNEVKGE